MSVDLTPMSGGDERETINNPKRGCGYIEDGKAYLKADVGTGGELPAFVTFEDAIPFKENRKRSYTRFPGVQFELAVTGDGGLTETEPEGEVWDHLDRMDADRPTGETAGDMIEFHSQDLLLSVGKTHYPDVEDFIDEARVHGVSKAISVTSGNEPPEVNPGRTRLFLIHPNAVEVEREIETTAGEMETDDEVLVINGGDLETDQPADLADDVPVTVRRQYNIPGVFGYTYLTRVVYTEDADGNVPSYIGDYEKTGDLDIVRVGREVPYSEQEHFNDDGEMLNEPKSAMSNGNLDAEAVMEGLEEHKEEIEEYAEQELQPPAEQFLENAKALEAPTIEKMPKAPLGELADEDEIEGVAPPSEQDRFSGEDGALALVELDDHYHKIMPTHILSWEDEPRTATTQVGPYRVTVVDHLEDDFRAVTVENTR